MRVDLLGLVLAAFGLPIAAARERTFCTTPEMCVPDRLRISFGDRDEPVMRGQKEVIDGEVLGFPRLLRGDANGDGAIDITDGIVILDFIFLGKGSLRCREWADFLDDGELDVSDAIACFQFLLAGRKPPSPPFPDCGIDPTPAEFPCPEHQPACR
jgi:hypothetical protein